MEYPGALLASAATMTHVAEGAGETQEGAGANPRGRWKDGNWLLQVTALDRALVLLWWTLLLLPPT